MNRPEASQYEYRVYTSEQVLRESTSDVVSFSASIFRRVQGLISEHGSGEFLPEYSSGKDLARLTTLPDGYFSSGQDSYLFTAHDSQEAANLVGAASVKIYSLAPQTVKVGGEIDRIVVHQGYQRRGIGKELIRRISSYLLQIRGCEEVQISPITVGGQALVERTGFSGTYNRYLSADTFGKL